MKIERHKIHKYRRVNIANKPREYYVYRCMLPNCNHYVKDVLILGKSSICWSCKIPFVIVKEKMKPICEDCRARKNSNLLDDEDEKALSFLKNSGVL